MKIHEYQAKDLLIAYKVNAQSGVAVNTVEQAEAAAQKMGGSLFVIKAQVHCGGRGKAGGVKFARTPDEVAEVAKKMLKMKLVTPQTGESGKIVNTILITGGIDIDKEFYVSITIDNDTASPVIIASGAGGTEIEEIAHTNPELIIRHNIPYFVGLKDYDARYVGQRIGIPANLMKDFCAMLKGMYKVFVDKDCSLVEINPLVITKQGELLAIDAKINFDDNALFRHPDILQLRDILEEDEREAEAAKNDLSYVSLDGNIGCMVNGAGLAMATMDIIKSFGGQPANFLDVGGSASAERVTAAFKILLSDKAVTTIFVNIFGGIMKCDVIAEGIIAAVHQTGLNVPLVVRLNGTNVDKGKEILSNSGLKIHAAADLEEGARLAVQLSR